MPEPRVPKLHASVKRIRNRTPEQLRDEVYRQMIRLEAGRPQADIQLALALLYAWMSLDAAHSKDEQFQWLRRICPVCIVMIGNGRSIPGGL